MRQRFAVLQSSGSGSAPLVEVREGAPREADGVVRGERGELE